MVLEINDSKTIKELQEVFSRQYPFLKLEFFEKPHKEGEASEGVKLHNDKTVGDVRTRHVYGIVMLDPTRTTAAVEQELENRFGLHAQVYRMLYDKWIQTIQTDNLTLEQQNALSQESASFFNPDHMFIEEDYREQE